MPNVDDHGLEVLKKAARNIDPTPKKDYALQVIVVGEEGSGPPALTPTISNVSAPNAGEEIEINIPPGTHAIYLRPRKISRMRIAYALGDTSANYISVGKGGFWFESRKITSPKIYLQTDIDNNLIECVFYN